MAVRGMLVLADLRVSGFCITTGLRAKTGFSRFRWNSGLLFGATVFYRRSDKQIIAAFDLPKLMILLQARQHVVDAVAIALDPFLELLGLQEMVDNLATCRSIRLGLQEPLNLVSHAGTTRMGL
ncbi:hypothetical protein X749_31355 [Mesorhizobium sp. LNJC391B00]|nr:hypothetical protein X749_31355 [Mesorhizobium sp. LNJC391B00]